MPTREELIDIAKQAVAEGDEATAHKAMDMIDAMPKDASPYGADVPLVAGMQGYEEQKAAEQKQREDYAAANPEPGMLDKVGSALSAGARTLAAAPLGLIGATIGGAHGLLGGGGEQQAKDMAAFTAPATYGANPLTQQYMNNIGETLGSLDPGMGAMAGIRQSPMASPAVTKIGETATGKSIANEAGLLPRSISDLKEVGQGISENIAANRGSLIPPKPINENLQTINRLLAKDSSRELATKELKVVDPSLKDSNGNLRPEAYAVIDDPIAKEAIKNGIDDGVVGLIKTSDPYTAKMQTQMVNASEKHKSDLKYAADNRPSDIIGNEILSNYKHVEAKNKIAGKAIDNEAKTTLKGNLVDISAPMDEFKTALQDDLGVTLRTNKDGKIIPVFKGSEINLSTYKRDREFIGKIVDDLQNAGVPDAYNVHKFKRAIDNMVVYGDEKSSLNGTVERTVKKLRNGLDTVLDNNFEAYNKANQDYSTTIKALGDIREAAGKRLKFNDDGAGSQLGVLSRGMLSTNKSKQQITNAILGLQDTANNYGANSKADFKNLVMFDNELDRRFGSHAPRSFGGEIQKSAATAGAEAIGKAGISMATGSKHGLLSAAIDVKNKAFGTTNKDAYNSLRKLTVKQYGKKEAAQ